MELFVTVILLTVTGAQASQLEGPQNTLSVVGSNVTLKCSSPSRKCSGIEWSKYSAETRPKCTTNASLNDTVEKDGVQLSCVVTNNETNRISMVWKGVKDSPTAPKNETQPKCLKFAHQNEAREVTYNRTNRASINASLNGTVKGGGELLDSVVTYNETTATSMVCIGVEESGKTISRSNFVVASGPEVPSFTCITSFAVETKAYGATINGLATNIPGITCATSAIKVLYSVRDVILLPSGNVIICTAKGQPLPTFKWQEMGNNYTWMDIPNQNGNEYTITNVNSKRYRCVAMNVVRGKSCNATSHEFLVNKTDYKDRLAATTMSPLILNSTTLPSKSTTLPSTVMVYIRVAVGAAVGLLLLISLLIICFCVRVCPGYKCCHSEKKSKDNIREEQPLTENPDACIYSVVNKKQDAHPKAKPSLASTSGSPNRPPGATPQAMPRTDNSKAGQTNAYQHEEVTYADLAMEVGPRKVVPKYNPEPQETLYAAVGEA